MRKRGANPANLAEVRMEGCNTFLKEELRVIAHQHGAVNCIESGVLTAHHVLGVLSWRRSLANACPQGNRKEATRGIEFRGRDWDEVVTR